MHSYWLLLIAGLCLLAKTGGVATDKNKITTDIPNHTTSEQQTDITTDSDDYPSTKQTPEKIKTVPRKQSSISKLVDSYKKPKPPPVKIGGAPVSKLDWSKLLENEEFKQKGSAGPSSSEIQNYPSIHKISLDDVARALSVASDIKTEHSGILHSLEVLAESFKADMDDVEKVLTEKLSETNINTSKSMEALAYYIVQLNDSISQLGQKISKQEKAIEEKLTKEEAKNVTEKATVPTEPPIKATYTPVVLPQKVYPTDCFHIRRLNYTRSGFYTIFLPDKKPGIDGPLTPLTVFCDMDTGGGGWLTVLRRTDTSGSFHRKKWADFAEGFGTEKSFYLGNRYLNFLTSHGSYALRVDLEDWEGNERYAEYDYFRVGPHSDYFRLYLGKYTSGTAGDSLEHHNRQQFSTTDADHDDYSGHCANKYRAGWWFYGCHNALLTGEYMMAENNKTSMGVLWGTWKGHNYSYKRAEMKIRPYL